LAQIHQDSEKFYSNSLKRPFFQTSEAFFGEKAFRQPLTQINKHQRLCPYVFRIITTFCPPLINTPHTTQIKKEAFYFGGAGRGGYVCSGSLSRSTLLFSPLSSRTRLRVPAFTHCPHSSSVSAHFA
jgi:hypothetical protein